MFSAQYRTLGNLRLRSEAVFHTIRSEESQKGVLANSPEGHERDSHQTCAPAVPTPSNETSQGLPAGHRSGDVHRNACALKHQNYHSYMKVIADCDMFLNPFPFGNTNGIVDTVWAGLVGVCKTGREVHEHIDEGMFHRLGFPEWTIAKTKEAYVDAALRMIEDKEERDALTAQLAGPQAIEKLIFKGRPEILGERIEEIWSQKLPAGEAQAS